MKSGEPRRRSSRGSGSRPASARAGSSQQVAERRHQTCLKRVTFPLDDDHRASCELLSTSCGNSFFHFLADKLEVGHATKPRPDGTAKGSYRKIQSKIKLAIPLTCLRRNGGFSLLYTNERSGCL